MITLLDVAADVQSDIKAGIIIQISETTPILNLVPIITTESLWHEFELEGSLPELQTRNINSTFANEYKGTVKPGLKTLDVAGGKFHIDRILKDERSKFTGRDQLATQLMAYKRGLPLDLKKQLVTGNKIVNPGDIDGLEGNLAKLPTTQQIAFAGSASGKSIAAATTQEIVDSIEALFDLNIGAGGIAFAVANREILRAINGKLVTAGSNDVLATKFKYKNIEFDIPNGKTKKVKCGIWNEDTIIYPTDWDSQKNQILTQTEPALDGSGNTFSTMYGVAVGEDTFAWLWKYKEGMMITEVPGENGKDYVLEWPQGFVCYDENAIGASRGWAL